MESIATSGPPSRETRGGGSLDRVATVVTYVLSPPVLLPLLIWLVLRWVGATTGEKLILVTGVAALLSIPPLAFAIWMVTSKRSGSLNLENRRHRSQAMAVALVGGLLWFALIAAVLQTARELILAITVAYLVTTALLILINHRWRISLHMASVAGFLAVVVFVATVTADPSSGHIAPVTVAGLAAVCVAVVGWSRLRLQAHSVGQVVGGAVVGFVLPYLILRLFAVVTPFGISG